MRNSSSRGASSRRVSPDSLVVPVLSHPGALLASVIAGRCDARACAKTHILWPDSLACGSFPFALLLHDPHVPVKSVVRDESRGPDIKAVSVGCLRCRWVYVADSAECREEHNQAAVASVLVPRYSSTLMLDLRGKGNHEGEVAALDGAHDASRDPFGCAQCSSCAVSPRRSTRRGRRAVRRTDACQSRRLWAVGYGCARSCL